MAGFSKINDFVQKIADLPDQPTPGGGYTASSLKAYWDINVELTRLAFNALIDVVESVTPNNSGAKYTGLDPVVAFGASNVQDAMQELSDALIAATTGTLPNDSIDIEKLAATVIAGLSKFYTKFGFNEYNMSFTNTHIENGVIALGSYDQVQNIDSDYVYNIYEDDYAGQSFKVSANFIPATDRKKNLFASVALPPEEASVSI